ncbi:MAG TPA: caspase family protein [Rhizobacter sp.]|nr:caspase family protein [Rhizobacter sp.]
MSHTRALIVGIEQYDHPGWDVEGPCAGAIAVAQWLLGLKNTALRMDLFLRPRQALADSVTQALQRKDVTLHADADWASLDRFVRTQLTLGCPAGSKLLVFWSGHGYTSVYSSDRFFFCRDYDIELPNRAFNGSNLLRMLRTAKYSCFDNQVFLADVCGVYDKPISDTREAQAQLATHQLAYFATPEGSYANSFTAGGMFTQTALDVLGGLGDGWADHDALSDGLTQAFAKVGATPFRIAALRDQQETLDSMVGRVSPLTGNAVFQSASGLLTRLDVVERVFRPHYLRTVADLGDPNLAKAQGLSGGLQELSSLRDANANQPVSHGLMQFLMRLAQEPTLAQPINDWLDIAARDQRNSRDEVARKLREEALQKILMIEIQISPLRREIASFEPFLCHGNGSFVEGRVFAKQAVASWDELTTGLQALFAQFIEGGSFSNLQIHFLVDPPLFDRPFHRIPMTPGGLPIGDEAVVVLRHRQRMLSADVGLRKKWSDYAEALRTVAPDKLKWLPVEAGNAVLPLKEGLCFAAFSLPHANAGITSCDQEKQVLHKLLKLGTPCLYLPHSNPHGADWKPVRSGLTKLLKALPQLNAFVDRFQDERTRGSPLACNATLLWDDPLSNPFISTRGANDE